MDQSKNLIPIDETYAFPFRHESDLICRVVGFVSGINPAFEIGEFVIT